MKKFGLWILNHIRLILALTVVTVTLVVAGSVMLSSYLSYKKYEAQYYADDLAARSKVEPAPKGVEINDKFVSFNRDGFATSSKSSCKRKVTAIAEDLVAKKGNTTVKPTGEGGESYIPCLNDNGSIGMKFEIVGEASFVDLAFRINSPYHTKVDGEDVYGVKDLFSYINFKINGIVMDGDVDLTNDDDLPDWHLLVMRRFALAEGEYTVEIAPIAGKGAFMPDVRSITVFSNAQANIVIE